MNDSNINLIQQLFDQQRKHFDQRLDDLRTDFDGLRKKVSNGLSDDMAHAKTEIVEIRAWIRNHEQEKALSRGTRMMVWGGLLSGAISLVTMAVSQLWRKP